MPPPDLFFGSRAGRGQGFLGEDGFIFIGCGYRWICGI